MKEKMETGTDLFRTEKIPKILLKIAPPVMLARLGVGFCFADAGRRPLT